MSQNPRKFDVFYRLAPRDAITADRLNAIIGDIDARIAELQILKGGVEAAIEEIRNLGLDRIDATLQPLLATATDIVEQIDNLLTQIVAAPASAISVAAIPGLTANNVQAALAELQGDITTAAAAQAATDAALARKPSLGLVIALS
jgi:hypothetical protein